MTGSEYKKTLYDSYYTNIWKHSHSSDKIREYEFLARIYRKRYLGLFPANKEARIIDVPSGAGHFLYFLQKEGYTNTSGIDLSAEMVAHATSMGIRNIEQYDLFDYFPGKEGYYDMIVTFDLIEHLSKPEILAYLNLLRASLKPGGTILIGTLNSGSLFASRTLYIDFTHETGFTSGSLKQVMLASGFGQVRAYGEKVIIHDARSLVRAFLWKIIRSMLGFYTIVETGTGRGLRKGKPVYEPRMYAIGKRVE